MINGSTKLFGIIGNPVKHSLSPAMHNRAFAELGLNCAYLPFCVSDVQTAMAGMKALGIMGASVTIPHKQTVIEGLDGIDPVAEKIGAVNTLQIKYDSQERSLLYGSNTDWLGANRALLDKTPLKGKKAIILGAGGSARAIGFGLQEEGATVSLCSRTEESGKQLASALQCAWHPLTEADSLEADILINATSVGMAPKDQMSLVSQQAVGNFGTVMDIVYAPLKTKLLQDAERAGCQIVNGLEMLLFQGVAQFELWTDTKAPVAVMRQELMVATGN